MGVSENCGSFLADDDFLGRLMVNSCTLVGGCRDRFLMRTTLLHFGQTKVLDEDCRDVTRSFCLLRFSFAALCLSASNSQLAFLADECQLSWSDG